MPLRVVADINARQVSSLDLIPSELTYCCRLDAVEDLLEHPTFEADFETVTKGLPDLERIVSRIHAKHCKTKDFLNVLSVRHLLSSSRH